MSGPQHSGDTLLEVEKLEVWVSRSGSARSDVVAPMSFAMQRGSILGLVGETGAGKTLAVRAMLGLLPASCHAKGHLTVDGQSRDLSCPSEVRGLLGSTASVLLQNPAGTLDPLFRVGHQLIEGVVTRQRMSRRSAEERAEGLLRSLAFEQPRAVMKLYPHELSGGMSQRVGTAIALMPAPQLLIVDEPTSALDANIRLEVLELLTTTARTSGTGVIMVSHDLGLVGRFCDQLYVLYAGHIVEHGPTRGVLSQPEHPYTVSLLGCAASVTAAPRIPLQSITGAPPSPGGWPKGCVFHPRCRYGVSHCEAVRPGLVEGVGAHRAACHFAFGPQDNTPATS